MKKVIVALTLLLGHFLPAQTTVIFKGTQEGMSKKGFKSEIKSNKEDYKEIDLGNDVNWVLAQSNGIFEPKDNLIGVKFIAKGALYPISDLGDDETKKYLEHTVDYLKNNGYTVFHEDPDKEWAWPRLFNESNKYGIVLINYQDKKAAHLIPFEWEVKKYESKFIPYFELYSLDPFMKKWKDDNMDQKNSDF